MAMCLQSFVNKRTGNRKLENGCLKRSVRFVVLYFLWMFFYLFSFSQPSFPIRRQKGCSR